MLMILHRVSLLLFSCNLQGIKPIRRGNKHGICSCLMCVKFAFHNVCWTLQYLRFLRDETNIFLLDRWECFSVSPTGPRARVLVFELEHFHHLLDKIKSKEKEKSIKPSIRISSNELDIKLRNFLLLRIFFFSLFNIFPHKLVIKLDYSIVGQKICSPHIGTFIAGAVDRVDRSEAQFVS